MSELSVGSLSGLAANSYVIDVASGSSLDLSNGAVFPAGCIIAVKFANFTGTQTASLTGGNSVEVTDLSITHAMSSASNKLIISAYLGVVGNSNGRADVGLLVRDGTNDINEGDTAGNRSRVIANGKAGGTGNFVQNALAATFVYEPGSTASKTYTVRAKNVVSTTQTVYVNRGEVNDDNASVSRGSSGFVIQEVAG